MQSAQYSLFWLFSAVAGLRVEICRTWLTWYACAEPFHRNQRLLPSRRGGFTSIAITFPYACLGLLIFVNSCSLFFLNCPKLAVWQAMQNFSVSQLQDSLSFISQMWWIGLLSRMVSSLDRLHPRCSVSYWRPGAVGMWCQRQLFHEEGGSLRRPRLLYCIRWLGMPCGPLSSLPLLLTVTHWTSVHIADHCLCEWSVWVDNWLCSFLSSSASLHLCRCLLL